MSDNNSWDIFPSVFHPPEEEEEGKTLFNCPVSIFFRDWTILVNGLVFESVTMAKNDGVNLAASPHSWYRSQDSDSVRNTKQNRLHRPKAAASQHGAQVKSYSQNEHAFETELKTTLCFLDPDSHNQAMSLEPQCCVP